MTEDQVVDLLTAAAMFDRRTVGRADAKAWHAVVGDLSFDDALVAVRGHYTEGSDWLMPAHVRTRVRAMRRDRLERTPLPAPGAELTDDSVRYRESLAASIRSIADGRQVRRAIAPAGPSGPSADQAEALKAKPGTPAPNLTSQELAALQAAESRAERRPS
jgi:hypothetical protein